MGKIGLKEMKKRNRQMIVQMILENGGLSRVELAQETGLSPSTVSSLVGELLDDGVLVESGVRMSTAGRSRLELAINPSFGNIIIAQIERDGASLHIFDMALNEERTMQISNSYISGNELLIELTSMIFQNFNIEQIKSGKLAGIGLLFQEDMNESEFNVMYSTGFSSANISLREALITQFRVPVTEEYSQSYTLTNAMMKNRGDNKAEIQNSAHISIGTSILASITLDGKSIPLKKGQYADLTPLLGEEADRIMQLAEGKDVTESLQKQQSTIPSFILRLGGFIAMLCTIFPLDIVFVSAQAPLSNSFFEILSAQIKLIMQPENPPKIEKIDTEEQDISKEMAHRMRKRILCVS